MAGDKVVEMEMTLSHHERQIKELSEIASAQCKDIEWLKRRLNEALSRVAQAGDGFPPASAKSPHY